MASMSPIHAHGAPRTPEEAEAQYAAAIEASKITAVPGKGRPS